VSTAGGVNWGVVHCGSAGAGVAGTSQRGSLVSAGIPVNLPMPGNISPGTDVCGAGGVAVAKGFGPTGSAATTACCACCSRQPGGAGTSPRAISRGSTSSVTWQPKEESYVG